MSILSKIFNLVNSSSNDTIRINIEEVVIIKNTIDQNQDFLAL